MKVLILAAGYGTRLYSLAKDRPKPLLKINNRPLVNYILDRVRDIPGLNEVVVVTNDKFHAIFEAWAAQQTGFGHPIKVLNDGTTAPENRLGSVGDIRFSLKEARIDDDLLVVGGDNLFDYNILEYIAFARSQAPSVSIGLYDIGDLKEATKFGVVAIDNNAKVVSFEEKPKQPRSTLVAMCFYYFPRASLGLIDQYLQETTKSDTAGDYIRWLHERGSVYGFKFTGKWYDIGSIESYTQAQEKFGK
jgi:glucose-1-phosphate thymidylyltransferase